MTSSSLLLLLILIAAISYFFGRKRSEVVAQSVGGVRYLHSLPNYYGLMAAVWAGIPGFVVLSLWVMFESTVIQGIVASSFPDSLKALSESQTNLLWSEINNLRSGVITNASDPALLTAAEQLTALEDRSSILKTILTLGLAGLTGAIGWKLIRPAQKARNQFEAFFRILLMLSSLIAIFTTVGIVFSVLFESVRFFREVPFFDFIFGTKWSPQIAVTADVPGSSGAFGAVPLFVGTLLIAFIALLIAVPIGLMSAVYLVEYASSKVRNVVKPLLEVLAGIPTVVYGFFAALTMAPQLKNFFEGIGVNGVSSESALAAGLVMGIMIIPFVSSLADDVISAVPNSLRDGSYGLGATRSETIKQVVFPAALPGIVGGILLAASRAIGETMIVVMAAGLAANLTANPLEAVTTVTVQIATLLVGDQEFDSAKTLSAFALGLMLFFTTLMLNVVALAVVKRFREQYD
ncbi:phosphate ABC transporter permease subunit PstC [Reinekea blandensis]|uniref:Phosphate transport system permease protein n=1 Tax=Reinekea blandensis MED297 TaxID=314283 RepID=A4BF29_9GAMM|nr:phosphate ABC transporter permease subunit PstC [Reinekea blandensis]EAR09364.1 phosphate ABC transporter, permease protein PstC [Reinekea sp. MED297] [Reinekea blandensis MED297]